MPRVPHLNIDYDLREVSLDKRVPPGAVISGYCPVLDGVDGRFNGQIKPFPGFTQIYQIGTTTGDPFIVYDCNYIEGVALNLGTENVVQGFVARVRTSNYELSDDEWRLVFEYREGGQWKSKTIETFNDSDTLIKDAAISVFSLDRQLYIYRDGTTPKMLYFSAANVPLVVDAGPGAQPLILDDATNKIARLNLYQSVAEGTTIAGIGQPSQDDTTHDGGRDKAHSLQAGQYSVAWQFYDTVSGRRSPLSEIYTISAEPAPTVVDPEEEARVARFANEDDPAYGLLQIELDSYDADDPIVEAGVSTDPNDNLWNFTGRFDSIRIYRSVRLESAGSVRQAAILHLENQIKLDADLVTVTGTGTGDKAAERFNQYVDLTTANGSGPTFRYFFDLPDVALALQDPYDNSLALLPNLPSTGAAGLLGDTVFVSNKVQGSNSNDEISQIRWTLPIEDSSGELFPIELKKSVGNPNRCPIKYVKAGDFMIGVAPSNIYYILKANNTVEIREALEGFGATNYQGACSAGDSAYILSPQGLLEVTSQAQMAPVQVFDNVLKGNDDGWQMAHDSATGSIWIHNPSTLQSLILWTTTNKATSFQGLAAKALGQGYDPIGGDGRSRALFVLANGQIYTPRETPGTIMLDNKGSGYLPQKIVSGTWTNAALKTITFADTDGNPNDLTEYKTARKNLIGVTLCGIAGPDLGKVATITEIDWPGSGADSGVITLTLSGDTLDPTDTDNVYLTNAIPMRIRGWPLPAYTEGQVNAPTPFPDTSSRRILNSVGVIFDLISGTNSTDPAIATYITNVYKGSANTPALTAQYVDDSGTAIAVLDGPPAYHTKTSITGGLLLPEIQIFVRDWQFILYNMKVNADIQPEAY